MNRLLQSNRQYLRTSSYHRNARSTVFLDVPIALIMSTPMIRLFSNFGTVYSRFSLIYSSFLDKRTEGSKTSRMEDPWVSVEQISTHLGVKPDTVYKWIDRHKLPAHKVGRLWKFKISEVDDWVRSDARQSPESAGNGGQPE